MAQILVPGVAQAVITGNHNTQPWAIIHHWRFGTATSAWSQQNIQLLADTLSSAWGTQLAPMCGTDVVLTSVVTQDIGSTAAVVGSNTTSHAGTRSGGSVPNAAQCFVMRFNVNRRYRGGHPRTYLPFGTGVDTLNNFQWTSAAVTSFTNAFVAWITAVVNALPGTGSGAANHCVPRYTYTYAPNPSGRKIIKTRTGLLEVATVQSYIGNQQFGTQRRRLTLG